MRPGTWLLLVMTVCAQMQSGERQSEQMPVAKQGVARCKRWQFIGAAVLCIRLKASSRVGTTLFMPAMTMTCSGP